MVLKSGREARLPKAEFPQYKPWRGLGPTWAPKLCEIMACMAVIMGLVRAIILHAFGV